MPARPKALVPPAPAVRPSGATHRSRPSRKPRPPALQVQGSLWIEAGGRSLGGHGRMALLQAVAERGSITHAARAFGMSYKAAWDAIDLMNTLSGTPLVERVTGGKGGGGTRLSAHGQRLIERYRQLDEV
ncbi:MAG: winged helix-turn-helix domain-containing protein, partial [Rubrivivax sp.]